MLSEWEKDQTKKRRLKTGPLSVKVSNKQIYLHTPNVSITVPIVKMSVVNFNGYIYFSKDRWIVLGQKRVLT